METSAISYRVADFLKQHPPFHAVAEQDLVALAANGRVRFYEADEFILWQGEPHKAYVFVIQQGTVSLWDERDGGAELRDVRGAGDLLGVERFHGAPCCLLTARSTSDVVAYAFLTDDFEAILAKYPYARDFVDGFGTVTDFRGTDEHLDPQQIFLQDVARPLEACAPQDRVADAARRLAQSGADAMAVLDANARLAGLVTTAALLNWMADGGRADQPVLDLPLDTAPTVGPGASVTDGVLAMGASSSPAVAMTDDGTPTGRVLSVVTPHELRAAFGDDPAGILKDIRRAVDTPALFALNMRARACALHHLAGPASTDWITHFLELADIGILTRLIALTGESAPAGCWCVSGASGRGESVTRRAPHILLIHDHLATPSTLSQRYARVVDGLGECGYIHDTATLDPTFNVASVDEWTTRYRAWVTNPVIEGMAKNRSLFDLRPLHGDRTAWTDLRQRVMQAVDRDIVRILGHDCLATLPPLTFYQDAVVEESGEQTTVFRLQQSALGPLVDLGRVFGMAAQRVMGTSTLERFAIARHLLPEHEAIFRDASQALRIMLWQQGRIGISQGTTGAELPPTLLSRHDRHMLKSGFPAILRLLEFAADSAWLDAI